MSLIHEYNVFPTCCIYFRVKAYEELDIVRALYSIYKQLIVLNESWV